MRCCLAGARRARVHPAGEGGIPPVHDGLPAGAAADGSARPSDGGYGADPAAPPAGGNGPEPEAQTMGVEGVLC